MAKWKGRFDPRELEMDPRFQDESQDLWSPELSEVARGLLTSAVRCFAANGYHATTTRDIADVVGLSPAALYVYFASKEAALFEIIRSAHEQILVVVETLAAQDAVDPVERLRLLVSRYTAWHARHHVAARVAQYERAGLTPEHHAEIVRLRHLTNEVFRQTVSHAVEAERLDPVDINRVTRAVLSLSIDLVRWYRLNGPDSPEELGAFYGELAIRMVRLPSRALTREVEGTLRGRPSRVPPVGPVCTRARVHTLWPARLLLRVSPVARRGLVGVGLPGKAGSSPH